MKPSEMTNERIAEELIATIPHLSDEAWSCTDADDILREAAARLRKSEERVSKQKSINKELVDENEALRRRLKVAEDALDKVYKCIDNRYGVDASLLAKNIIADALDAIRGEGGEMRVTYKGITKNQSEWADFFGVTRGAITTRIHEYGETAEQAIRYFSTRVATGEKSREDKRRERDLKASSR